MPAPTDPHREQPSTYIVQDRSNLNELTRLQIQDQILTTGMGGVLPEQPDPTTFKRVLDVGCGTGGWLIEVAKTYPTTSLLIGVDISKRMIDQARKQAEAQHVSDRVEFHVMDALRVLEFPADYFDLVNQRLGVSYVRTWEWPRLLEEFQRIARPGGVIRLTETYLGAGAGIYPALESLHSILVQTLHQSGHLFTPEGDGITRALPRLLEQYGLQNVQTRTYNLHYASDTDQGRFFYEDVRYAYKTFVPFFNRWTRLPDDYEDIYQQALSEMKQPDFQVTWSLLTAWGSVPEDAILKRSSSQQ